MHCPVNLERINEPMVNQNKKTDKKMVGAAAIVLITAIFLHTGSLRAQTGACAQSC